MKACIAPGAPKSKTLIPGLLLLCCVSACATDWPQYRGPATDGYSPDLIATTWATNSPGFVVWTNMSLTNGLGSFAVSQGRAFTMISKTNAGVWREYCVAVDAATGMNIWSTPIDNTPMQWDPSINNGAGGDGTPPYDTGDGPRSTPAVTVTNVIVLSGRMVLASLNVTNGFTNWMKNLKTLYGASEVDSGWNNAASPRLDNDLIFVNLNTSTNNQTLYAFRTTDGSWVWRGQNEKLTHTTPVVATILGTRQVLFATVTGIVSLDRNTGAKLWKYTYPWGSVSMSMGASPVVYSNIVYCTASYGNGTAAARISVTNSTWTVTQLFYRTDVTHQNIWMTPVCYQGYIYTLQGFNSTFLTSPLNCIELSTGNLMWTSKYLCEDFGMGGLILVNTNLLALTEKGQLVLVQPNPTAYTELARYQAFRFNSSARGKCWNSPAFSDGRIYARSTRGGICLDVSVPPPLKMLSPQFLNSTQLQFVVSTADGTPIDSNRLPKIEVRATNNPAASASTWPRLTNQLVLATNGLVRLTNTISPGQSRQFYQATEQP